MRCLYCTRPLLRLRTESVYFFSLPFSTLQIFMLRRLHHTPATPAAPRHAATHQTGPSILPPHRSPSPRPPPTLTHSLTSPITSSPHHTHSHAPIPHHYSPHTSLSSLYFISFHFASLHLSPPPRLTCFPLPRRSTTRPRARSSRVRCATTCSTCCGS